MFDIRASIKKVNWRKVLDVLGWAGFFYLIAYGFLKVFGVIHSPPLVDATAIASLAFFAGKHVSKLDAIEKTLEQHTGELKEHSQSLNQINLRLGKHDAELHEVNKLISKF